MSQSSSAIHSSLEEAVKLHQEGYLTQAEALYIEILKNDANQADAKHLLGVVYQQQGHLAKSIDMIQSAIANKPEEAVFHFNLGNTFFQAQDFQAAINAYRQAKTLDSHVGPVHFQMAECHRAKREYGAAVKHYKEALSQLEHIDDAFVGLYQAWLELDELSETTYFFEQLIKNNIQHVYPYILLAQLYLRQNRYDDAKKLLTQGQGQFKNDWLLYQELANVDIVAGQTQSAIKVYQQALALFPQQFELHFGLANCYFDRQEWDQAVTHYLQTIALHPQFVDAYNNLGILYLTQKKFDKAQSILDKGLELAPHAVGLLYNSGNLYFEVGQLNNAQACYLKALEQNPKHMGAIQNLAILYQQCGKLQDAIELYATASQTYNDSQLLYNYGVLLFDANKLQEAQRVFEDCLKLTPLSNAALAKYYLVCRSLADWDKATPIEAKLDTLLTSSEPYPAPNGETPFLNVARVQDVASNQKVATAWSQYLSQTHQPITPAPSLGHGSKIRLGYLSNDFHDHATAHLITAMIEAHDRSTFEIFLFSYGVDDQSDYRHRLEQTADHFVDIREQGQKDAAITIYQHQIDILIDLKGYSQGSRLDICSYRPAPIQLSYLGFPGPIGGSLVDGIIADSIVIPEHARELYSDRVFYMPNCYQVNDGRQDILDTKKTKKDWGLPHDSFVFASFNQCYKIEPHLFSVWCQLLQSCENAILWLWVPNAQAQSHLKNHADAIAQCANRLYFAPSLPKAEHLHRLQSVDLALDTLTYNGHTTTSDALYAGVPVITCQGAHFASRVSASLLHTMELDELICHDLTQYLNLAKKYYQNPQALKTLKARVLAQKSNSSLYDTAQFTTDFERILLDFYAEKKNPLQADIAS